LEATKLKREVVHATAEKQSQLRNTRRSFVRFRAALPTQSMPGKPCKLKAKPMKLTEI
jgi:hypothetical protein